VLETRTLHGGTRRRRECANGHKFWTLEVTDSADARRQARRDKTLQLSAARVWARNQKICNDPRPSPAVGAAYGLSAPMVRKIRRLARPVANTHPMKGMP
jgi:hypothetical protein